MTQESETKESTPGLDELADSAQQSLFQEFRLFIVENKAWWMIPILIVIALVGILVAFASTGAAPFIYPGL